MAEDPEESEIGESGFPETRDSCTRESRYAIFRYNLNRPSVGQVATIENHRRLVPSENWEFRRHRHAGIENPETAKGNQDRPSFEGRVSVDLK
jgi:hypothetical protein